jgi:hypothetical protein
MDVQWGSFFCKAIILQFHVHCWSVVSLVGEYLLTTVWIHPEACLPLSFIDFFHFRVQDVRVRPVCICFLFGFSLQVFLSISSIVELCSMILPNFKYMRLMGNCIPLRVFSGSDPMIYPFSVFHLSFMYINHNNLFFESPCFVTYSFKIFPLALLCGCFELLP